MAKGKAKNTSSGKGDAIVPQYEITLLLLNRNNMLLLFVIWLFF